MRTPEGGSYRFALIEHVGRTVTMRGLCSWGVYDTSGVRTYFEAGTTCCWPLRRGQLTISYKTISDRHILNKAINHMLKYTVPPTTKHGLIS